MVQVIIGYALKKAKLAVRINVDYPSLTGIHIKNGIEEAIEYQLLAHLFSY
jgi:hypothetical protein